MIYNIKSQTSNWFMGYSVFPLVKNTATGTFTSTLSRIPVRSGRCSKCIMNLDFTQCVFIPSEYQLVPRPTLTLGLNMIQDLWVSSP